MRRLARVFAMSLGLLGSTCLSSSPEVSPDAEATASVAALPFTGETLTFPPPPTRRDRRPLPRGFADAAPDEAIAIAYPQLDDDGHFEFSGQTVRVRFNREIEPVPGSKAPPLTVTPAVKGKVERLAASVSFTAARPFDPDTQYTVELGPVRDKLTGTPVPPWKATFRADPRIEIAHKVIAYLPVPGKPRVVAVRPWDESRVGTRPELEVLFDQPVKPNAVAELLALTDVQDDAAVALALALAGKGEFEGYKVDRRHVVVVRPSAPLAPGHRYAFEARDHGVTAPATEGVERIEIAVAEPLRFVEVRCGYSRDDACSWDPAKNHLTLPGDDLTFVFNNTIGDTQAKVRAALSIEPEVRNLSVWIDRWSHEGRITVSGAFEPSTTYHVRLAGARDAFGSTLLRPLDFTAETRPLPASVAMPEGVQFLDAARSRAFAVTTRNVTHARLSLWEIGNTSEDWRDADRRVSMREPPSRAPTTVLEITPEAVKNRDVTTAVNLLDALVPGRTYLASIETRERAFGAASPAYPSWSWAAKPPLALLTVNDDDALAVHARTTPGGTLVHVARLADGTPLSGARLFLGDVEIPGVRTDATGFAALTAKGDAQTQVLRVEHGGHVTALPLGVRTQGHGDLVPELGRGDDPTDGDLRALVITDRGIYRPGATVHVKAMLRLPKGGKLVPAPSLVPARLRVVDPNGKSVFDRVLVPNDLGSVSTDVTTTANAEIGRYHVQVEPATGGSTWASTQIQVAEFEPPRFKVDVEAEARGTELAGTIDGRYLFGAAMDGAAVQWSIQRSEAPMPSGPFVARGLHFRPRREEVSGWSQSGLGVLDAAGRLAIAKTLEVPASLGPQRFTLEAEVTDSSHRAIANRKSVIVHPAEAYAGLKIDDRWPNVGTPIAVELGVIDREGRPVAGKPIAATLTHVGWKRVTRPGPGGSVRVDWKEERRAVGQCTVESQATVATCTLVPTKAGSYDVETAIEGRAGGSVRVWAWGSGEVATFEPSVGHRIEVLADKARHAVGETAEVKVRNPFAEATALFTIEDGKHVKHETRLVTQGPVAFQVPIAAEHAPHVHATVTLLPRGGAGASAEERADWKFGAIRLPVDLDGARLDVGVTSDRPHYQPGETAKLAVSVRKGGTAVAGAEVALAVVDEGILRLTDFRVADPVAALHPGRGLHFSIADTRQRLAEMLERSQVAGDGSEGGNASIVATRKDFVQTALWRPDLRTDANGTAEVELTLPDNLTQFRMMAVVLDAEGRGGGTESHFEVRKPLMAIPVVPRFAVAGDSFEAAVMVHSGLDTPTVATVALGERTQRIELAPLGRERVAFELTPETRGLDTLVFDLRDGEGVVRDRVEAKIPVQAPGIDDRPRLARSFVHVQEVSLAVPAGVQADLPKDEIVVITLGHLYPELGARLEYLLDYPHGCVEQTTSGTLPLLAARDVLPQLGLVGYDKDRIDAMIRAGIERLASMKTSTGGLAYWPGGYEPNVYGTAYAMRAVALAAKAGIEAPNDLLADMASYLEDALVADVGTNTSDMEIKASIALALAEAGKLPASSADMLMDTASHQGVFGLANLALALATLPGEEERIGTLLDVIEKGFDAEGRLTASEPSSAYAYYGSAQRTRSQALLALSRLRKASKLVPPLVETTVRGTESYTTQATAFGLIALREHLLDVHEARGKLRATLDGVELVPAPSSAELGENAHRYELPYERLAGKRALLRLESTSDVAVSFLIEAKWRQPIGTTHGLVATSAKQGPEVYRVYSDAAGNPIDLAAVAPGQVVRVALLARLPIDDLDRDRLGYLALTDRLPAGFEPIQPDLATVARPPELGDTHPLHDLLRWGGAEASHVELRDDRVHLYFDRIWSEFVAGTYLARATTPGRFSVAPAMAELMYEPDSTGYSDAAEIRVHP